MYPNYPCRAAQSCCNDLIDNCCNLGRRNQSMIDCCLPGRRLQDMRVLENKPRSHKCKGLAHSLTEAKQQAKMMATAEAIAQYEKLCIKANTNTRCAHGTKSASKSQVTSKQSPYATMRHGSQGSAARQSSSLSANQCSSSRISDQSVCFSTSKRNLSGGLDVPQYSDKKLAKRRGKDKDLKVRKNSSSYSISRAESGYDGKSCGPGGLHQMLSAQQNQKYLKNKQNYQCQDDFGVKKKRMEVICEEQEEMLCSEDDDFNTSSCDSPQDRKIQDSCADFLSIVNDSVLDTVQKSVETVLKDYFVHTLEKIECLCAQMVRNDCLMSKMYLDIMDKINQSNERNQRQFKCLCQFLLDTHKQPPEEKPSKPSSSSSSELECVKKCAGKNDPRCMCGCKRGFTEEEKANEKDCGPKEQANKENSHLSLNTENKHSDYSESARTTGGCCEVPTNANGESASKLNSSTWNSNGLAGNKSAHKSYKSELPSNVGLVDTVITEEIRYFRNQSRIVDRDGLRGVTKSSKTAEAHTKLGRPADAAGNDLPSEFITETHSKAMRSDKKRRSSDIVYTGTRQTHVKKKRSLR